MPTKYPYPEDLPKDLREIWNIGGDIHQGDEDKFRDWIRKMLEYIGFIDKPAD